MHSVYADMAAGGLSEAIQNLPPELREMILKEYIAIKIKEKGKWAGIRYTSIFQNRVGIRLTGIFQNCLSVNTGSRLYRW